MTRLTRSTTKAYGAWLVETWPAPDERSAIATCTNEDTHERRVYVYEDTADGLSQLFDLLRRHDG